MLSPLVFRWSLWQGIPVGSAGQGGEDFGVVEEAGGVVGRVRLADVDVEPASPAIAHDENRGPGRRRSSGRTPAPAEVEGVPGVGQREDYLVAGGQRGAEMVAGGGGPGRAGRRGFQ